MGVRLSVAGLLTGVEFRAGDDGGSGFVSATVLPEGSSETLSLWGFGDNAAAQHLVERFEEEGSGCQVLVGVELKAKSRQSGEPYLSTGIKWAVSPDGETIEGRIRQTTPA